MEGKESERMVVRDKQDGGRGRSFPLGVVRDRRESESSRRAVHW